MNRLRSVFREDTGYMRFFLSVILIGLAGGIHSGILNNYLSEFVGMNEFDRGLAEFFRELPGFALVFILALMYMFSAEKLYRIASVIMLAGLGLLAVVPPGKVLVTLAVCVFSLGEHIQLGMKSSITLEYSRPSRGGEALGFLNAISHVGTLVGLLVVMFTFMWLTGYRVYRGFFAASALIMAAGAAISLTLKGSAAPDRNASRFYIRRKFRKYYMLEIFYGARKQVFMTFGPYVLIRMYSANTSTISLLYALSAVLCFFLSPLVGKIIDRAGYRIVMIMDTVILVAVCFFYGFAHHLFPANIAFIVCCVNYLLDSVISLASMASNVYVQDISDSKEEVRATISTGISVNHLISILIALFGGWIWQKLGVETLFTVSAVLGLCNSAYAATIKTSGRKSAQGA